MHVFRFAINSYFAHVSVCRLLMNLVGAVGERATDVPYGESPQASHKHWKVRNCNIRVHFAQFLMQQTGISYCAR
uniref:Putative secreted protein n=1 Tax=Anopheles darlingi TaxID=43151 RepID=A0A2M4D6N0_ANODA